MYNEEYVKELKKYSEKKILNFDNRATLKKDEHKLIVDNASGEVLKKVYVELDDLLIADLSDFFAMERSDDRNN